MVYTQLKDCRWYQPVGGKFAEVNSSSTHSQWTIQSENKYDKKTKMTTIGTVVKTNVRQQPVEQVGDFTFLKPMTDDPSSPSKKLVRELARKTLFVTPSKKLVRELARKTLFVCHAFSHEFFLVRETCSELVTALFCPSFSCEFLGQRTCVVCHGLKNTPH